MLRLLALCSVLTWTACSPPGETAVAEPHADAAVATDPSPLAWQPAGERQSTGQVVYVPVYSHVYAGDRQRALDLAVTLSIRSTDPRTPIRLRAVRYAASDGAPVRGYLAAPQTLAPMASASFVVDEGDTAGGSGAHFLVAWDADAPAAAPVVEAVMIGTASQQGISFVTQGRPLGAPLDPRPDTTSAREAPTGRRGLPGRG